MYISKHLYILPYIHIYSARLATGCNCLCIFDSGWSNILGVVGPFCHVMSHMHFSLIPLRELAVKHPHH